MKKQSFITILLTMFITMVGAKAFAYDIAVMNADGVAIYYNWSYNKTELIVTSLYGYGEGGGYFASNIVIPEYVQYGEKTYNVIAIDGGAFDGCKNLKSVTIPNGVTTIGYYAFDGCI